jgi:hypothetical protein
MALQEHIAHIDRMQQETREYCAEMRRSSEPPYASLLWSIIACTASGALLFAAGAIFMKLVQ